MPARRAVRAHFGATAWQEDVGSPERWGFACYLASKDRYEESVLPTGACTGTPEEALDCACGLYLNDPSVWSEAHPPIIGAGTSEDDHLAGEP